MVIGGHFILLTSLMEVKISTYNLSENVILGVFSMVLGVAESKSLVKLEMGDHWRSILILEAKMEVK